MSDEVKKYVRGTEFTPMATAGDDGVHLVCTWGGEDKDGYVMIVDDETLALPAGGYRKTEENLKQSGGKIQILAVLRSDRNGYRIEGKAHLESEGPVFERVKERFKWARAALVLKVDGYESLLKKK